jgi:hypothetical protein
MNKEIKVTSQPISIYQTQRGDTIFVVQGAKSKFDFIVKYRSPRKRIRTPKHIHLLIDLYAKITGNENLAMKLIDHIITLIEKVKPETTFPPELEFFSDADVMAFSELDRFGEYSAEFLLVLIELILRQEKTNYPNGVLSLSFFNAIRRKADIYSIVNIASFNRRR